MKHPRQAFERFCLRNRNRGIPNLMLFIAIGNVLVFFIASMDRSGMLANLLIFNRAAILHGQIWRLFTYIFTYMIGLGGMSLLLGVISLLCYYFMGRILEQQWGVMRFNLYYLCGILLMDIAALLLDCSATTTYLNTSLFLAVATLIPDTRFLLFYIIPIKAKYLAWADILFTLYGIAQSLVYCLQISALTVRVFFVCLFPVIALANYFLFFGKDAASILPDFLRHRSTRTQRTYRAQSSYQNPRQNARRSGGPQAEKPYRHKCTVCGRTDADFPFLEFRYCSRCKGFYCYCEDHINNHQHIQ